MDVGEEVEARVRASTHFAEGLCVQLLPCLALWQDQRLLPLLAQILIAQSKRTITARSQGKRKMGLEKVFDVHIYHISDHASLTRRITVVGTWTQ